MSVKNLKLNKCNSCVMSEFCKAYDKTDNSLFDCSDYIRYSENSIKKSLTYMIKKYEKY